VIIRYADNKGNGTPTGHTGSSPYVSGGYKYYKFYGSGSLVLPSS
jgi:hypothetical protein